MFRDLCKETITLRFPDGASSDGQTVYSECTARAFFFDYSKRLLQEVELQENTRFFLIAATTAVNAGFAQTLDGVQAVSGEQTYDLKSVKACRQVDGRIECYSCIAF